MDDLNKTISLLKKRITFKGSIAMLTVTLLLLFFLSLNVATVSNVVMMPVLCVFFLKVGDGKSFSLRSAVDLVAS